MRHWVVSNLEEPNDGRRRRDEPLWSEDGGQVPMTRVGSLALELRRFVHDDPGESLFLLSGERRGGLLLESESIDLGGRLGGEVGDGRVVDRCRFGGWS